jgi:hypothetical protein
MRNLLLSLFLAIFIVMLAMTVRASLACSILNVSAVVTADPWFQATLTDAYLGFLTFYAWVAYKETSWLSRVLWFVLIMCLGNMAMAGYVILKLIALPANASASQLLLRQPASSSQIAE